MTASFAHPLRPNDQFDLTRLMQLEGVGLVSLTSEVRWTNRFIIIGAGQRPQEPQGYHDIGMPADGAVITVSDGTTRTVLPATAGVSGATGGVPLQAWESLWYQIPRGTNAGFDATRLRIQKYNHAPTVNMLNNIAHSEEWVLVVSRDSNNHFKFGTGDTTVLGGQFGVGADMQAVVDRRAQESLHMLGGYVVRAWNSLDPLAFTFGFNGTLRSIVQGNDIYLSRPGYRNIAPPAVGTIVYGASGLPNSAFRASVAGDDLWRFGEPHTTTIADTIALYDFTLDNETLWFAPDLRDPSVSVGTWYRTRHTQSSFIPPSHWIRIAQRSLDTGTIQLWNGEALPRGAALPRGIIDYQLARARRGVTKSRGYHCRFSQDGFFSGTGDNGLGTSLVTNAMLISWSDNTLMSGMDGNNMPTGVPYTWLNVPPVGYAIRMLDTQSTRTRVVQDIGGQRFIPLSPWEALVYVGDAIGGSTASVPHGYFVVNYNDPHYLPPHAITVAMRTGDSAATTLSRGMVKMVCGATLYPGRNLAVGTPTLFDHAHGTREDWTNAVPAGQTPPAATASLPAVAGVLGLYPALELQYMPTHVDGDPRGGVRLRGMMQLNGSIAGSANIAFIPGATVARITIMTLPSVSNSVGLVDSRVVPVQVRFLNGSVGGQNGLLVRAYLNSFSTTSNPYFTLGLNGGSASAGTPEWVSFDNVTLHSA